MHHVDRDDPVGGDLAGDGDPRRAGQGPLRRLSNFAGWHIAQAQEAARRATSSAWSASSRSTTCSTAPSSSRCSRPREATASASSRGARCNGGLLGGVLRKRAKGTPPPGDTRSRALEKHRRRDRGLRGVLRRPRRAARRRRASPGCCTSPPSPRRSSARARSSSSTAPCARSTSTLDDSALARLDEIFPGPGGAAPEAYAW